MCAGARLRGTKVILLRAKQNEGEDASPPCKAGWYVSIFRNQQNHPLSAICEEKRQWNSHSEINPVLMKKFHQESRSK